MVYDSGLYRNAASPRAHTIVGNESIDPAEYRRKAKAELADAYPWTTFRQGRIVSLVKDGEMFAAEDEHGNTIQARKVVLATGIKDVLPDIPGELHLTKTATCR
jgi:thioredoxin reductase